MSNSILRSAGEGREFSVVRRQEHALATLSYEPTTSFKGDYSASVQEGEAGLRQICEQLFDNIAGLRPRSCPAPENQTVAFLDIIRKLARSASGNLTLVILRQRYDCGLGQRYAKRKRNARNRGNLCLARADPKGRFKG
jgi:hypothetical protein